MDTTTSSSEGVLLIIDDTPGNVKLLMNFLTRAGFKVLVAKEGEQGIKIVQSLHPDLILLDVMMPEMDGFEVCRVLKSNPETQSIPIIFMTALTDLIDKVRGFQVGAADYITKPVHYEEVLARINTHLNLCRLQQQLQKQNEVLLYEINLRKEIEASLQLTNNLLAERTVELQKQTTELEQRNMELDAFAHTVAHDLKTPLTGIIGVTELLKDDFDNYPCLDMDFKSQFHLLEVAGDQMANIIDGLLLLAGISRQITIEIHPLDMASIVNNVLEGQSFIIKHYQGEIYLPSHWLTAQGYSPWIKEVWMNYLSNALKYGGRPPRLEFGSDFQTGGMVRFWVRDNGYGLTPEAQSKLFTPFSRLHQQRIEGHGLGLSIVKHIVEKLGGQVGIESAPAQGSLFYFTLPKGES